MSRNLIDRDVLIATLNREKIKYNADVNYFIMDAPTVDAVEVVHCRECKWWINGMCYSDNFILRFEEVTPDWFCADGAKMDGEVKRDGN